MSTAVKISDSLARKAKIYAKIENRSIAGQIEYWAKMGELVMENPELPFSFIQETLIGREEILMGLGEEYKFGAE